VQRDQKTLANKETDLLGHEIELGIERRNTAIDDQRVIVELFDLWGVALFMSILDRHGVAIETL